MKSLFILKSLSLKYTFFSNQQVSISKKKDIFKCFHSVLDMGKTNKEIQAKGRKKLKKDEKACKEYLSKDRMRRKLK